MPFTTNQKFAAAGAVLLIVIIVIIFVTKKDTTKPSSTTKPSPITTRPSPSTTKRVTYSDETDGPHRIIGNDYYYKYKGESDKAFATGKWIGPNEYAVFIDAWKGWIVMQIASDFTMKTAWKPEASTYVPTVADIATLTKDKIKLTWT